MTELLIASGLLGTLGVVLGILFRGQNQRIEQLYQRKTEKDVCKIIHTNVDNTLAEIKEMVKETNTSVLNIEKNIARMKGAS